MTILLTNYCKNIFRKTIIQNKYISRPIFEWLNIAFNQIDVERLKQVGPDRVCAEWILRNGGTIKWVGAKDFVTDYNVLPPDGAKLFIEKVDASDSSITHHGFIHFKDCNYIKEVILHKCNYIEDEALKQLHFLQKTLLALEISECANLTAEGLLYLKVLKNLKTLKLMRLYNVKEKEKIVQNLKSGLLTCKIISDFDKTRNL